MPTEAGESIMPRSLLKNNRLKNSSSLRFILMFLGICILLGSVAVWFGVADFDHQYSFDREQPPSEISFREETRTDPYDQLQPETRRIVDQALNGREFTFEDGEKQLPTRIRRGNTYYEFISKRTLDYTNPATFGPILLGIFGLYLVIEAIQHERMRG